MSKAAVGLDWLLLALGAKLHIDQSTQNAFRPPALEQSGSLILYIESFHIQGKSKLTFKSKLLKDAIGIR